MFNRLYIIFLWIFLFGAISLMANVNGNKSPVDPAKKDVEEISECCKHFLVGEIMKDCSIEDLIICLRRQDANKNKTTTPKSKPQNNTRAVLVSY